MKKTIIAAAVLAAALGAGAAQPTAQEIEAARAERAIKALEQQESDRKAAAEREAILADARPAKDDPYNVKGAAGLLVLGGLVAWYVRRKR